MKRKFFKSLIIFGSLSFSCIIVIGTALAIILTIGTTVALFSKPFDGCEIFNICTQIMPYIALIIFFFSDMNYKHSLIEKLSKYI